MSITHSYPAPPVPNPPITDLHISQIICILIAHTPNMYNYWSRHVCFSRCARQIFKWLEMCVITHCAPQKPTIDSLRKQILHTGQEKARGSVPPITHPNILKELFLQKQFYILDVKLSNYVCNNYTAIPVEMTDPLYYHLTKHIGIHMHHVLQSMNYDTPRIYSTSYPTMPTM